jgi:peptidoglycan/LPS O-acetylase OafA/YrhL
MKLVYRADIDGLRAIAVLAVLFFHTNIPGFSGGFVGVDIFFVISGFLITSIILKDIHEENFSIARFYERRIRRIFPALFPVIVFSLVVGAFLLDPNAFNSLGKSISATTLFYSNIQFWQESGYFAAPSLEKPLLHTWSLAVEEQFYILFPLALRFINKSLKSRYLPWLFFAAIISLLLSINAVYHDPKTAFYFVHTRAWELLAGSILALRVLPNPSSDWIRNLLSITGIGLILYCICFYNEATWFPGYNAVAPVSGAGLIIYSGIEGRESYVSRVLKAKPLVFVGLISYSLYLWHWPFMAFTRYFLFRPLTGYDGVVIILTSFFFSILSWKYIEQPFRGKYPVLLDRKKLFVFAGIVMIIFSSLGGLIVLQNGMPLRNSLNVNLYTFQRVGESDDYQKELQSGNIGETSKTASFMLWGDSHAEALIPAIAEKAKQYRLAGFVKTCGGIPPLLNIERDTPNYKVAKKNAEVIDFIKSHPEVKVVIIACNWSGYSGMIHSVIKKDQTFPNNQHEYALLVQDGLLRSIRKITDLGRKVILVNQCPYVEFDPMRLLWLSKLSGEDYHERLPSKVDYNTKNYDINNMLLNASNSNQIRLVHLENGLFDEFGKVRMLDQNKFLYTDAHHLSVSGSRYVAPVFDDVFRDMAAGEKLYGSVEKFAGKGI